MCDKLQGIFGTGERPANFPGIMCSTEFSSFVQLLKTRIKQNYTYRFRAYQKIKTLAF